MTAPRSPARLAIDTVLADGQPHDRDELLEAAMVAVPPGRAWRTAEAARRGNQRRRGQPETTRNRGDDATAISAGARRVAVDTLHQAVAHGTVTRHRDGTYQQTSAALTGGPVASCPGA